MDAVYNKYYNIYDVVIHELNYSDYAKENPEDLALIMPKYISYSLKKAENKIAQIESLPPSLEKFAKVFSARFNYLDKLNLNLDILE